MVARYVYLHIDLDKEKELASAWDKLYKRKAGGIPYVQVVSSDDRVLHDKPGGVDLDDLQKLLAKSGRIIDERTAGAIKKALESAKKYADEGNTAKAVQTILPALQAAVGAAGEIPQQAVEFGKKLVEQAKADVTEAESKLASADTAVEGAAKLLQISRDFAKVPDLAPQIKAIGLKKNHKDTKQAFQQAADLMAADTMAATKKTSQATKKYQAIIKKWPDSAVAKLAETKMQALGAEPDKTAGTDKTASTEKVTRPVKTTSGKKPVTAAQKKEAEELMGLAESFADSDKDLAKDYAKKVVGLVPGTELAQKAEELIKKL